MNLCECEWCKYWICVNDVTIGYKWVYAIWMLTSDDTMKLIMNDHDWKMDGRNV